MEDHWVKTSIKQKTLYKAFGFNVLSDIFLPELPKIEYKDEADILIEYKRLTSIWEELSEESQYFVLKKDLILFRLPEKAIFMIKNGNEIYYYPMNNTTEDQIRLYLLGTCMGAILMQRKVLPLHGSAIAIGGKAYAIVGDSGAGKSTLASAFLKRGYQLISDDVIPVTLNQENIPMITPAYPQQKLWQESLDQFKMESSQYRPIIERESKFAIPVLNQFASRPLPLSGVFELIKTENDDIQFNRINNLQSLHTLFHHTYRNFFIVPLGLMDWHFNMTAKMCERISLFQIRRPVSRFSALDLVEIILSTVKKEEGMYG